MSQGACGKPYKDLGPVRLPPRCTASALIVMGSLRLGRKARLHNGVLAKPYSAYLWTIG
jgi:hypothetical protein